MLNKKILNGLACIGLLILCASSAVSAQAATGGQVRVRVVHASPDTPAADVYVNGVRAFKKLAFKDVSAYAALAAGSYRLQLVPAGKTLLQGPILISTTAKFEAGKDYTVIGQGLREDIAPLVLMDDNTLPDAKKAKVRFVHLSPDAPAVDVIVPAANNLKLFSGVAFQKAGDYVTVDAGRYNLAVKEAGKDEALLNLKGVPVGNGQVITVFGMGLVKGQPKLRAVVSVDAAATKLFPTTGGEVAESVHANSQAEASTPVWSLVAIGVGLILLSLPLGLWHKAKLTR